VVLDGVADRVGAVVVGVGGVAESAVAVDGHRAVAGAGADHAQGLAGLVGRAGAVIAEHIDGVGGAVLGHRRAVVMRDRGVVDLADGDRDARRGLLGVGGAVGGAVVLDGVADRVGAVVVGVG